MTTTVNRWGENGPRPEPNHDLDALFGAMTAEAQVVVAASPEECWALVSDITRIGEFSPECIDAQWLEDSPMEAVGGRFEGTNRVERGGDTLEWIRVCEVLEWDPPRRFAYVVGDRFDGTAVSRWGFDLAPAGAATRITQTFRHYPDGLSGVRVSAEADPAAAAAIVAERTVDLEAGMSQTLERMRAVLEQGRAE